MKQLCAVVIIAVWQTNTFQAPQGFPLEALGRVDRDRRIINYAAKATWQATSVHRFDASFFGDPATGAMGPQRTSSLLNAATSGYSSLEYGGHNQTVHYDGVLSSHFLVDASFGRALNRILETPAANDWQLTDFRVTPRAIRGGLGFYEAGNRSNNWQFQAKATNIKVFANYGRYYARVPSDLAARALSGDSSIIADYFDANLTQPVPNGVVTTNAATGAVTTTHFTLLGAGADEIDPSAKLSYYNK